MKKNNFPNRLAATRVHGSGSTARSAFGAVIHGIAKVLVLATSPRPRHASSDSLVEVHMPDGQIAYVEASPHRTDATLGPMARRAWQAIGQAITRTLTLQNPSHMSARAYVPVRVTNDRRARS